MILNIIMSNVSKILFLNQMAGPLFRELAEDLSIKMPGNSILLTGHHDSLILKNPLSKLKTFKAPTYNRRSKLSRVLSWLSYSLVAFWQMLMCDKRTIIIIVSNSPFLNFFVLFISILKKTRYVVLVYDIHPDTLINFGALKENSFITKIWRLINRLMWERSVAVYTIGAVMAQNLSKKFNVKKSKLGRVGIVSPWVDTSKIKPIDILQNPLIELTKGSKLTVLYSGNMGVSHDMDSILQAAKILKDEKNIMFLLIGAGAKWQDALEFQVKNNLTNLQVLPFQPESKLPYTMTLADIALVSLDDGAEGLMLPSKIVYYMAAGAAIIGICKGENDVSKIIQNSSCGIIVEPKNPKRLAITIKDLAIDTKKLNEFKESARKSAVANFSRNICTEKLNQEILSVIN
jgi:colanic acid biosynthesis glycosyl transferase WcaI